MAIFDPLHPLQSSLLEILSAEPGLSMEALRAKLGAEYDQTVSLQNLYRLVGRLIDQQVLVRSGGKLFLNAVWLSHIMQFAQRAEQHYLTAPGDAVELPAKEGGQSEYAGDSLRGLDSIWNDILLRFVDAVEERSWYAFNSHPWYNLGMFETELRLYQGLHARGIRTYMLFGGGTFLDRYGDSLIRTEGLVTAVAGEAPFAREDYAVWAAGEYLLEVVMSPLIARHFSFFFNRIESLEQYHPRLFADVFRMRERCSVKVSRSRKRADEVRRAIRPYFRGKRAAGGK